MRFLFVCTGNTCRSPMAERLARKLYPGHEWHSAGVMPTYDIQPMTVQVIEEAGGDASGFEGTDIKDLRLDSFDHIVLIGETARNYTGRLPAGVRSQVWYIFDPYNAVGTDEEKLDIYREVREEILKHVHELAEEAGIETQSAG
jgi:arsenate reductase